MHNRENNINCIWHLFLLLLKCKGLTFLFTERGTAAAKKNNYQNQKNSLTVLCFPSPSSSRIASMRLSVLLYQNCSFPPRRCAFSRSALACPWFLSRLANTANKYKHLDTSYRALNSYGESYVTYTQKIHYCSSYLLLFIF